MLCHASDLAEFPVCGQCCASDLAELPVTVIWQNCLYVDSVQVIWQNRLYVEESASDLAELPACRGVCQLFSRIACASNLAKLPICGQCYNSDLAELSVQVIWSVCGQCCDSDLAELHVVCGGVVCQ